MFVSRRWSSIQVQFSDIRRDSCGRVVSPTVVLKKPHGEIIGPLGHAFGLRLELKFNEISSGSFCYPKRVDGRNTPFYDSLVGDKLLQIDPIGIFIISEPEETVEGHKKIKEVNFKSREYELAGKQTVFASGTYNFWNPADAENTLLGMVLENAPNWKVGYVSPTLIGRYRTFDDTESKVLEFLQGDVQESYGCVIIFDTYQRTVNAYDAADKSEILPIYLSYSNLLKQGVIAELDQTLITKLYVQGADDLDIRDVNPTGDNYIYNLDYYIENGDIPDDLAAKWVTWQNTVFARQKYYTELVSLRSSATGRKVVEDAKLVDLKSELATLENLRATYLQMQMQLDRNDDEWVSFQAKLDDANIQCSDIEHKIEIQKRIISEVSEELEGYRAAIKQVNDELRLTSYFTNDELSVLEDYFKEDSFVYNTFATFDIDVSRDGGIAVDGDTVINFRGITWVDVPCETADSAADTATGSYAITLPEGRMRGDVDGDGKIEETDYTALSRFNAGWDECAWVGDEEAADVVGDGEINGKDVVRLRRILASSTPGTAGPEVTGNWTNNPNAGTETGQFYTDIQISGLTKDDIADITVAGGTFDGIDHVECLDGVLRVYVTLCPISEVPCTVVVNGGESWKGTHRIAAISGGDISMSVNDQTLEAHVDSGTLDRVGDKIVCSLCLGNGYFDQDKFPSGNVTFVAYASYDTDQLLGGMEKHEETQLSADDSVSHTMYYYTGDAEIETTGCKVYITRNATEYQRYSVAQELYDFASEQHKEIARPAYEFEIESGNIVFEQKFSAFKDALRLGCACYLQLDSDLLLTPILIEIHLDFDDPKQFSLIFANQFRRPDSVNTLKDAVSDAVSASRRFDSSKLSYGENKNTTTWVKDLLKSGYDAALAQIQAGKDNLVTIDQAGIKIDSSEGVDKIYLNNGMIALLDKRTNTVKMAMGHFFNPASGVDFVGILADIIGGVLLAGQNLIIECPDPNGGVMQFKVDSSGVILNNGRMYMRTDKGAMGFDANHGFFAGTAGLFETTDTGYVHPVCVDENGQLILDSDGFPVDTNVWIGIDGEVYIRGNIYANDGVFNGTVYARSGEFKGIVQASDFLDNAGNSMMTPDGKLSGEYLDLRGVNIVDENGNAIVTIDENGLRWSADYSPIKYQYSADNSNWHNTMASGDKYRRESYDGGVTWGTGYQFVGTDGADGSNASVPSYIKKTYIDATTIKSPSIEANEFNVYPYDENDYTGSYNIYGMFNLTGGQYHMFAIQYNGSYDVPRIYIGSPAGGEIHMNQNASGAAYNNGFMSFHNTVDFSDADVTGLYLTFS